MELQQFIDNHFEGGEVYSDNENIKFKRVHFEEYTEYKTVTFTEVHSLVGTDEYFEITTNRDNVGYWGDSDSYPPTFRKVQRVEKLVPTVFWIDV